MSAVTMGNDITHDGGPSALDYPLHVTFFKDASAHSKKDAEVSLRALIPRFQSTSAPSKALLPWIKLATFGNQRTDRGSLRHDRNILSVHGIEADYDGETITVERARQIIASAGLAAVIYTSPSHTDAAPRWRILCPLAIPIGPEQRARMVARLNGLFVGALARESFTASQAYYYGFIQGATDHCVVAIEPGTGEVLAFINNPDYDPNTMVGRDRANTFKSLLRDPQKPLYNRAVKGVYPPGSTFKTVMALIAMQEGVLTPETTHGCGGGYRLGSIRVGCHPHGGPLDLRGSIRISCNSYYCQVFRDIIDNPEYGNVKVGYAALEKHLRSFGLGSPLGIDLLGESRGNIPSVSQLDRRHGDRWKSSTIISLSIGQGEILLTPLQMCNTAAIIANRGWYYSPHLIKRIDGYKDTAWDRKYKIKKFTTVDPRYFQYVIDGMSDVTKPGGTANGTGIENVEICAKTGTAQNPHGKDHSIYIAFAPKDNPKIAIAVLVENGGFGATWAAPIANLMIEKYLQGKAESSKPAMEERIKTSVIQ